MFRFWMFFFILTYFHPALAEFTVNQYVRAPKGETEVVGLVKAIRGDQIEIEYKDSNGSKVTIAVEKAVAKEPEVIKIGGFVDSTGKQVVSTFAVRIAPEKYALCRPNGEKTNSEVLTRFGLQGLRFQPAQFDTRTGKPIPNDLSQLFRKIYDKSDLIFSKSKPLTYPSGTPLGKTRILHVGQTHWIPVLNDVDVFALDAWDGPEYLKEDYKAIVQSQFKIASFLQKHPGAIVFAEGTTEVLNGNTSLYKDTFDLVRKDFAQGLPENPESLNELQKFSLANLGAAKIMLATGKLNAIYPTSYPEKEEKIIGKMKYKEEQVKRSLGLEYDRLHRRMVELQKGLPCGDSYSQAYRHQQIQDLQNQLKDIRSKIENSPKDIPAYLDDLLTREVRERLALQRIKEYLEAHPTSQDREILLIYGAAHDFERYNQPGNPSQVEIVRWKPE